MNENVPNCALADYIQIASYDYVDSQQPFASGAPPELLQTFDTPLRVGRKYTLQQDFTDSMTTYSLFSCNPPVLLEQKFVTYPSLGSKNPKGKLIFVFFICSFTLSIARRHSTPALLWRQLSASDTLSGVYLLRPELRRKCWAVSL